MLARARALFKWRASWQRVEGQQMELRLTWPAPQPPAEKGREFESFFATEFHLNALLSPSSAINQRRRGGATPCFGARLAAQMRRRQVRPWRDEKRRRSIRLSIGRRLACPSDYLSSLAGRF